MEKVIRINEWSGRLGNNIIQIANASVIAEHLDCEVVYPRHSNFKPSPEIKGRKILHSSPCWDFRDIVKRLSIKDQIDTRAIQKGGINKVKNEFYKKNVPLLYNKKEIPYKWTIHLRSGDIYNNKTFHRYRNAQPKLEHYKNIIDKYDIKFDEMCVVTDTSEGGLNPALSFFKKNNVIIKGKKLQNAIDHIANANNLIKSASTFMRISFFNDNLLNGGINI